MPETQDVASRKLKTDKLIKEIAELVESINYLLGQQKEEAKNYEWFRDLKKWLETMKSTQKFLQTILLSSNIPSFYGNFETILLTKRLIKSLDSNQILEGYYRYAHDDYQWLFMRKIDCYQ